MFVVDLRSVGGGGGLKFGTGRIECSKITSSLARFPEFLYYFPEYRSKSHAPKLQPNKNTSCKLGDISSHSWSVVNREKYLQRAFIFAFYSLSRSITSR